MRFRPTSDPSTLAQATVSQGPPLLTFLSLTPDRTQLQALAKKLKLKANGKTADLITAILASLATAAASQAPVQPEPAPAEVRTEG